MAEGAGSGGSAPWVPARDRTDPRTAFRIAAGLFAVFVAILAVLALLNSFFIQPAPGPVGPTADPSPSPGEQGGEGDVDVTCQDVVDFLFWVFVGITGVTLVLLGLAVAFRNKNDGRILTSIWGILAVIGLFFSLLAAGAWRLVDWLCNGAPTCSDLIDGFYVTFLILITLTVGSVIFGIAFAHLRKISFFRTGLGVLGLVLYLPALLTGVGWWVLRTFCNPDLWITRPCTYLQDTMSVLAWIFWLSLIGAIAALVVGILYWRQTKINAFRSGWAMLSILLVVLSIFSGAGWLGIKAIHDEIDLCNPPEEEEPPETTEPPEPPQCEDILDRIATAFWILMGVVALLIIAGLIFNHKSARDFFTSVWAIIGYVVLAVAILVGLSYLIASSFCDGSSDEPGGGGDGSGPGGGGGGGGGGGAGDQPITPVQFDALPLTWVLIILAVLLGAGLLLLLFRRRSALGRAGPAGAPPEAEVPTDEMRKLREILDKRKLESKDAVVAAYRVFLAWAAGQDLGKEPQQTPREHAGRVRAKFPVAEKPMQEFIDAYEVARLSNREPTAAQRKLAVKFSQEILGEGAQPAPEEGEQP